MRTASSPSRTPGCAPIGSTRRLSSSVQGRFNATAHYVLYRAVIHPSLRQHLDDGALSDAMARGRSIPATDALALHGIARPTGRLPSTPG
jgi:hypothetical protein